MFRMPTAPSLSFYLYSLTRGMPSVLRAASWPRITRYDDRWRWISTSVVPHFRRLDADMRRIDASLGRIFDDARDYAATPCVLPPVTEQSPRQPPKDNAPQEPGE